MDDAISRQDAIRLVHSVLYEMMVDAAATEIEKPMSKEDKLLLKVNRAVCTALKDLPSAEPVRKPDEWCTDCKEYDHEKNCCPRFNRVIKSALKDAEPEPHWIPVTERLPEDIRPVIVTWKNTDPASYYQYIVGKHFTGTACYKNGKWYWYSSTTEDMLAEYGRYDSEEFDEAIECIAWMPLPGPWEGERE